MLTVYFLRHAETPCNARDLMCGGTCDVDLDARGRTMAEAIVDGLGHRRFRGIVTSDRRRAQQTIAPLAKQMRLEPIVDARWRELDYGQWDGRRPPDLIAEDPDFTNFRLDPSGTNPPGGESIRECAERAMRALDALRGQIPGGEALVCTHKTLLRLLLCRVLGIDIRHYRARFGCAPASLTVVELDDRGPRVLGLGIMEHLPRELRPDLGDA